MEDPRIELNKLWIGWGIRNDALMQKLQWVLQIVRRLKFFPMWNLIGDWYVATVLEIRREIVAARRDYILAALNPDTYWTPYWKSWVNHTGITFMTLYRPRRMPWDLRRRILPVSYEYYFLEAERRRRWIRDWITGSASVLAGCRRLPLEIWTIIREHVFEELRAYTRYHTCVQVIGYLHPIRTFCDHQIPCPLQIKFDKC